VSAVLPAEGESAGAMEKPKASGLFVMARRQAVDEADGGREAVDIFQRGEGDVVARRFELGFQFLFRLADILFAERIAALRDEAVNDAIKGKAVVKARFGELPDLRDMVRRKRGRQRDRRRSAFHFNDKSF